MNLCWGPGFPHEIIRYLLQIDKWVSIAKKKVHHPSSILKGDVLLNVQI